MLNCDTEREPRTLKLKSALCTPSLTYTPGYHTTPCIGTKCHQQMCIVKMQRYRISIIICLLWWILIQQPMIILRMENICSGQQMHIFRLTSLFVNITPRFIVYLLYWKNNNNYIFSLRRHLQI